MSQAQEIVTVGEEKDGWSSVNIRCSECSYVAFTGAPTKVIASRSSWISDHLSQHNPGRALDIEVSWEPSACCSVCEDGIGSIRWHEDGGVWCTECKTIWDENGQYGMTE